MSAASQPFKRVGYSMVHTPGAPVPEAAPDEAPQIPASVMAGEPVSHYVGLNPQDWTTLSEAQAALRGWVLQEHANRTGARQVIVDELSRLSVIERTAAEEAALHQNIAWAAALKVVDAARDRKAAEIGVLATLDEARAYAAGIAEDWGG